MSDLMAIAKEAAHNIDIRIDRQSYKLEDAEDLILAALTKAQDSADLTTAYMLGFEKGKDAAVPDGWKLVPIKPTEAMIQAGYCDTKGESEPFDHYRAMLAVAPKQPQSNGG